MTSTDSPQSRPLSAVSLHELSQWARSNCPPGWADEIDRLIVSVAAPPLPRHADIERVARHLFSAASRATSAAQNSPEWSWAELELHPDYQDGWMAAARAAIAAGLDPSRVT